MIYVTAHLRHGMDGRDARALYFKVSFLTRQTAPQPLEGTHNASE